MDARNYLPCPLCLGFFLRADLWKHQASCRKKLAPDLSKNSSHRTTEMTSDPSKNTTSDSTGESGYQVEVDGTSKSTGDMSTAEQTGTSETGTKRPQTSDLRVEQPRKRCRVQAAASRLLPISSGASESCSEILHRMNQDHVSYQVCPVMCVHVSLCASVCVNPSVPPSFQVKSDWLICKYGNKLMGSQDGSQKRYDYVSQKLRKLGKFLLAAKSLDSGIVTLQDLLAPGRLSLALAAARKASGYRWSRPPLSVKTTLKTVCEIAIGESLQDGDWEAAAKTTDFYHLLGRDWDNLGLLTPDPDAGNTSVPSYSGDVIGGLSLMFILNIFSSAAAVEAAKLKKRLVDSQSEKKLEEPGQDQSDQSSQSKSSRLTSRTLTHTTGVDPPKTSNPVAKLLCVSTFLRF